MDAVIAGASTIIGDDAVTVHIGIEGGKIAALVAADRKVPDARQRIDADGLIVLPGAIDAHTHFTAPFDDASDEVREGTRGAASGGITTVLEMPHGGPPTTSLERFLAKRAMMERHALVDFGLWGGLTGKNLDQLPLLDEAGAVAMKGFTCSGNPTGEPTNSRGMPMLDDDQILSAMHVIASFDGLIGLHAESHAILHGRMNALIAEGRADAQAHAESSPEIGEVEAVSRAIVLARETGVRCHIVHLSTARAAEIVREARKDTRISAETCPQYLMLDEDDLVRIGGIARCGPPLRKRQTVDELWRRVKDRSIDILTSDHCPYPPEIKAGSSSSIWNVAKGITGIQTLCSLFFSAAVQERGLSLADYVRMTSTGPARLFGLYPRKGAVAIGSDADFAFYNPQASWTVRGKDFFGHAKWTPFEGMRSTNRIERTIVRGTTVFSDGRVTADAGHGRYVGREERGNGPVARPGSR